MCVYLPIDPFKGEYPLDANVPSSLSPNRKAAWISRANAELIRIADMTMASLNDFGGKGEPDSGTAIGSDVPLPWVTPFGRMDRVPQRLSNLCKRGRTPDAPFPFAEVHILSKTPD